MPTPSDSIASSHSDCYESSDDCTNSNIPCVGIEDTDEEEGNALLDEGGNDEAHDELSTPIPPPSSGAEESITSPMNLDDARNSSNLPKAQAILSSHPGTTSAAAARSSSQASFFDDGGGFDGVEEPPEQVLRRVETDELAQQSRDDKLLDAAGGGGAALGSSGHTPLIEKGEALTEANVEKFQREERIRQRDGG